MNTALNHARHQSNLTEMYPGIYQASQHDHVDGQNLPTGPLNTLLGFELETYQIPLDQLLPSKKVPDGVMSTRKYKQIVSSINEVGLIEPLSVIQPDRKKPEYMVLDGHLRVLALKELGMSVGPCLFAKDDETFSYNHHINRLSTIAEHYMIRRAIDRGVSKERLARAFNVNLSSINRRINLLEGIRLQLDKTNASHLQVFEALRAKDIMVNLHYIPVHTQPYYQQLGFKQGDYPEAEQYYREAISIPMHPTLTESEQDTVINALKEALV